ncbi:MAG: extracellular solute-binding protein [Clostridia bacterium]|nr:extracellular solute-binding protein [Clostridia bacterium]
MKRNIRNCITAALFTALISTVCACGTPPAETQKPEAGTDNSPVTVSETESAVPEYVYEYTAEYSGGVFRILNAEDIYSMHAQIDREGENGEALNDILYNRCRAFEDKTGVTLEETGKNVDADLANYGRKIVKSGDDLYDIFFVPARDLNTFVKDGYLYNLPDIEGFRFDEPWWLKTYNDGITVNGNLYVAASYTQLMIIDSIWCMYFNENIMSNLDLELPYDLVRGGKWTLDRLGEYLKAAASLNGDNSFSNDATGNCFYGCAYPNIYGFLTGTNENIIRNNNGSLELTAGTERFYNVVSSLARLVTTTDGRFYMTYSGAVDDNPASYIGVFENQRSLFLTAEISKTNRLRDKDFSFGICPYPKYDENQDAYYVSSFYGTPCLSIPVTVSDPVRSAKLSDALSYLSYDMVMPVFRETTLEQKNLRNEDSVEMLNIIMQSVVPDLTWTFANATNKFKESLNAEVTKNNDEVASLLESHRAKIQDAIDNYNLD